jgi:hypothetical protein
MYRSYQWIQTVSSSGEFEASRGLKLHSPHVDGSRDASGKLINYPFYFTNSELSYSPLQNLFYPSSTVPEFNDHPFGESWFLAEATLVGVDFNGKLNPLGTYNWGYANTSGTPEAIAPQFYLTPSPFQQSIINNYNNR